MWLRGRGVVKCGSTAQHVVALVFCIVFVFFQCFFLLAFLKFF